MWMRCDLALLSVMVAHLVLAKDGPKDNGQYSKCMIERREATEVARRQSSEVLIPTCNSDGSYNEIQCHTSTGYCWCVTRDGRHIPGTSVKGRRPRCKGKRRKKKGRSGKNKKKRACSSKDRQTFNSALIQVFKEEYDRVFPPSSSSSASTSSSSASSSSSSSSSNGAERADEFGTEKAIVVWKFSGLDTDKDGDLKLKEIRSFGRMVKKLIKPRSCAKRFLDFCDKNNDRKIEKPEWTLCLGVDIKPGAALSEDKPEVAREATFLQPPDMPVLSSRPTPSRHVRTDRKEPTSRSCNEERQAALASHDQEPNAKHFIPRCSPSGKWSKAQCHQATEYCWCVHEDTGIPIPGTATHKVEPNCTFDNEREMKGCPFEEKRRFLIDLMNDLTDEMSKSSDTANTTSDSPRDSLSLRETVARWKLKSLDKNDNGILERKEWRPLRRGTLKNKEYPRKCRRSFLRYCDVDNNKKLTLDEWRDCLGLNHNYFSSLPLNPKRRGKNPFMDQLT